MRKTEAGMQADSVNGFHLHSSFFILHSAFA